MTVLLFGRETSFEEVLELLVVQDGARKTVQIHMLKFSLHGELEILSHLQTT